MALLKHAARNVIMTGMGVPIVSGFLTFLLMAVSPPDVAPDRLVKDGAGRTVRMPARPARIVSLAPSVTELLFALGVGDRVVGVTDFCDYPSEVTSRPRIGGLINPDLERIVSLRPDLVVATTAGNYLDDAERIERLGIPVYTLGAPTVEAMLTTLETVGGLVGAPDRARQLAGDLRRRIQRVVAAAALHGRVRALFVIEPDPLIAPGRGTFIGEALALAGADLVTVDAPRSWAQYDLEQVIGMRPEVILTPEANRAWALGLPGRQDWTKVPAVATGRVYVISDSIQHPGPRMIDGIEEVEAIVARATKR